MKKLAIIVLCITIMFTLFACNNENNTGTQNSNKENSTEFDDNPSNPSGEDGSYSIENSSNTTSSINKNPTSSGNGSSSGGGSIGTDFSMENNTGIADEKFNYASYYEALYFSWEEADAKNAEVFVRQAGQGSFKSVDKPLIRQINQTTARVDILGLAKGFYDVRIKPSGTSNYVQYNNVEVRTNYDRSGYAHFQLIKSEGNYQRSIGAYKADGTLKDNAIVIYVTPETKDTVVVPGYEELGTGIGYILNVKNKTVYSAFPRGIAKITQDHPVCVRFIGTITNPKGTTERNKEDTGWYAPDIENGCQVKMNGVNNLTLEGVGTDAVIDGWGVAIYSDEEAKSDFVEIRNLTFQNNPEDAVSILGTKNASGVTEYSVERCFVHHNRFNRGYCANPTESDKGAGDGSLDVKKCNNITLAYNYLYKCKKTGLCGGEDSDMQNLITYHHNWYDSCESRCPLARQAVIHMYNNYMSGNSSTISARANVYIFSENNYYENCKNTCSTTSGGVVKSLGDVMVGCGGISGFTVVTDRKTYVPTNNHYCKNEYNLQNSGNECNIENSPAYFYYSASKGSSKVTLLTSAEQAKQDCIAYSGVLKENIKI